MSRWEVRFRPVDVVIASGTRSLDSMAQGDKGDLSPLAFAGALRTALKPAAESSGKSLDLGIGSGDPDQPTGFRFTGPFLASSSGTWLLPLPRHLLALNRRVQPLAMGKAEVYRADEALSPCAILTTEKREAEVLSEWVQFPSLLRLLSLGAIDEAIFDNALFFPPVAQPRESWVKEEPRTGHHRDGSGSVAKEGGLFTRTALRFNEEIASSGLVGAGYAGLVEIPGELDQALGRLQWVRLGGDGHKAACEVKAPEPIPKALREELAKAIRSKKGMVLYLATPAIFEEGWQPRWHAILPGWSLKAAAVGRSLPIAGWDYAKEPPRPVYRAVPPGSVYFLQAPNDLSEKAARPVYRAVPPGSVYFLQAPNDLSEKAASEVVDRFLLKESLSDRYGCLGFGYTLVGAWDPEGRTTGAGKEVHL